MIPINKREKLSIFEFFFLLDNDIFNFFEKTAKEPIFIDVLRHIFFDKDASSRSID